MGDRRHLGCDCPRCGRRPTGKPVCGTRGPGWTSHQCNDSEVGASKAYWCWQEGTWSAALSSRLHSGLPANQPQASIAFLSHPSCCGGAAVLLACLMTNSIFHPHLIMQQSLMGRLPSVLFPGVGWCRPEVHSLCSVSCPARPLCLHVWNADSPRRVWR